MKLDFIHLIPEDFGDSSRVWVYQSNRVFSLSEAISIEDMLNEFSANWKSHGTPVKGFGTMFFGQFIILMADEEVTGVSGCSTDSSVRLIKAIEQQFNVALFNRTTLAFYINEKIQLLPISQLQYAIEQSFVSPNTLFFDNTVQNKKELISRWIVPLRNSWLANRFSLQINE